MAKKKVKIVGVPKYKIGGPAPTADDSMAVANNAQAVLDYYRNRGYQQGPTQYTKNSDSNAFRKLEESKSMFMKDTRPVRYPTQGGAAESRVPMSMYHQDVDTNRFRQRENAAATLDTRAPMPLYDKRITPTAHYQFSNENHNDPLYGDVVDMYGYDPLAVTPYHMLTPEQQKMRNERYGGTPPPHHNIPRLPIGYNPSPQPTTMNQVDIPPMPDIKQQGWYSNSQGVGVDADDQQVAMLYNEDGTRKYQYGGTMNKKVRIIATPDARAVRIEETPEMKWGGARPTSGPNSSGYNQLDTRWNPYSYNGMTGVNPKPDPYAETGKTLPEVPEEIANVNAEKQEKVLGNFTPDGLPSLMNVGGPSHAEGGKDIRVPDGAFIYSDTAKLKIKDPAILKLFGETKAKTPARIATKYDLQKYTKILADPKSDQVSRDTAEMMVANYTDKLNQLAAHQEQMKEIKGLKNPDQQDIQMPMAATGGPFGVYSTDENTTEDNTYGVHPLGYNIEYAPDYMGRPTPYATGNQQSVSASRVSPQQVSLPLQPTNMQADTENMNQQGNLGSVDADTIGKDKKGQVTPYGYTTPNKIGIATSLANMAGIHKYMPWEAPINAVAPKVSYLDPTRALAANSEAANQQSYNAALSGNSRAARATSAAIQGEAGANAANIIGQYANQNVQIANKHNEDVAAISNKIQELQAARMNRLHQGNTIAAQQYDNAIREARNDLSKQYQQAWKDRQAYDDMNQLNQYYYRDPSTGRITFRPGMSAAAYSKILASKGQGSGMFNSPEEVANYYRDHGVTDPKLIEGAVDDYIRNYGGIDNKKGSKTVKKEGNTTTTQYNKYGGKLKKFLSNGL
jgi:hypothetical protein